MANSQAASNLADFWAGTLQRARATPMDVSVEKVPDPLPYFVHRLTFKSLGGVPVRGYLGLPVNDGRNGEPKRRLPLVVTTTGYGGPEFGQMLSECQRGYAILQVYPRSQGESGELWRVEESADRAWVNHGKANREGFYYQGAVMDLVRAIDYAVTRDDIDAARIGVNATSQGGMLALQLASVDARVKACVAHVPYLCDLRNNAAFADSPLLRDAEFLATWDSFDPVNLAPWITAPTLLSSGGADALCPAATIHAVFARLAGVKSIAHFPELAHTSSGDFYTMGWAWLARYLG